MPNYANAGKGSSPRPFSISNEEYAQRWDAIFRRDDEDEDDEELEDTEEGEDDE